MKYKKKQQYSSIFGRIKGRYVETRVGSGRTRMKSFIISYFQLYFDISYTFNEVKGSGFSKI